MFGTAMLLGSSYPFAKDVLAVMSPLLYSASRYLVAALFLFAVAVLLRKPIAPARRDWLPMFLLSLVGVALFQASWGLAMARTPPSVGSIVMTTTTAFSAILAWFAGRRLPALGWLGIVIAFAGVVVVVNNSLTRFTPLIRQPGRDADLDGGCLCLGALCRAQCALQPAAGRSAGDGLDHPDRLADPAAHRARCSISLGEFARLDDRLLGFWLYTAIFPVGVAFLGLTAGLERLGVSRVMVYMYLIPIAGVGLSAAFFGDPLTAARVLGGLIVLLGVILTRVALDRAARVPV